MFLRLPREYEDHGFSIAGNTGSGKTTILRQMLYQVKKRGDTAVIHDPDRQFVEEFYDEARGDLVLNPDDARCPFWHPGYEVKSKAHALTMAEGLIQPREGENRWFVDHAQKLMAFLGYGEFPFEPRHRPSVEDLIYWMCNPRILDRLIKGTPLAETMTNNAAEQRAGIIGTFNRVYYSLSLLPTSPDGRAFFAVRDWCEARKGWLFFTSTPNSQQALQPIHSLWFDMILLGLISMGKRPDLPSAWIMLDELSSLQYLPHLERGLTRLRKTGNVFVLAFQDKSQVDHLYGKLSESILSQAATQIILRQKNAAPAEWGSKIIGQAITEGIRDTRSLGLFYFGRDSQSTDRHKEEVVLPSEIQGLPDLQGYLTFLTYLVKIKIKRIPSRSIAQGFLPISDPLPSAMTPSPILDIPEENDALLPVPVQNNGPDSSVTVDLARFS